jgi:beta-galactosidase
MSIKDQNLPDFPYGAVYYRVSNPPKKDWERDYKVASEDSNNIFRHWFLWSAIERSPGEYTWDNYDRQLDLCAENGIKTIIAEMMTTAPEWAARLHPHARIEAADGSLTQQGMHGSCATGGIRLCLDNPDLKARAEEFLTRLTERYKDHPGLGGYDIWNECNERECYCEGTLEKYRTWLKKKYGSIENLRDEWWRPGLATWEDVVPPRKLLPYNDSLDWLKFHIDNNHEKMQWRADIISGIDPNHKITAHGLGMSLKRMPVGGLDDWRAADIVESYGVTWGSSRHGDDPWKQPQAMDLIRNASRGKPFWHAECYGGPLWMASNVLDKPRDEGRIATPEDIRYWQMTSYMHGATGSLFLRWRPLLDGVLFGAFGPYGMDGSRTDRSDASTAIAQWCQDDKQKELWKSRPVKGEVGILFNPDAELLTYTQQYDTKFFSDCYEGAYRGFYDNNIQADFVNLDDMDDWDFLYLPYPVMIRQEVAQKIMKWVEKGGTLVSEGCPAYWGDKAHVGEVQPNLGLDKMFGCKENYVEFTPDLLDNLEMTVLGNFTWGGIYLQSYEATTGTAVGWYKDGHVAAVENTYGKGKTLLMGSMAGRGYSVHEGEGSSEFYKSLMTFAGKTQKIKVSDKRIRVRMHSGDGGDYLWIANAKKGVDIPAIIEAGSKEIKSVSPLKGTAGELKNGQLHISVPARDVIVLKVELK